MTNELRQGLNKVEIVGVVKENKLKAGATEKGNYINGSLVIKAGEFTEIEVNVFVNEKNSKGDTKKVYTTLKSILDGEEKTMAEVNEDEAVKVRVWGNGDFTPRFKEDLYVSKNDREEVKSIRKIDLGFGNVTIDDTIKPEDYKAEFEVEIYIHRLVDEVVKENGFDKPTGRLIMKGWLPVYGGLVMPLDVVAGVVTDEEGDFNFAEQLRNNIYEGLTLNLWGNIDFKKIVDKVKKGGSLGRAKIDEKTIYINDLVAVGGDIISNIEKAFDMELIKKAIAERDIKKEEKLQQYKEHSNKKSRGLSGFTSSSTRTVTEDEIPF